MRYVFPVLAVNLDPACYQPRPVMDRSQASLCVHVIGATRRLFAIERASLCILSHKLVDLQGPVLEQERKQKLRYGHPRCT